MKLSQWRLQLTDCDVCTTFRPSPSSYSHNYFISTRFVTSCKPPNLTYYSGYPSFLILFRQCNWWNISITSISYMRPYSVRMLPICPAYISLPIFQYPSFNLTANVWSFPSNRTSSLLIAIVLVVSISSHGASDTELGKARPIDEFREGKSVPSICLTQ